MNKWLAIIITGLISACGVEKTEISSMQDPEQAVDEIFSAFIGEVPGAAVMVIQDGNVTLEKGYGMARVADKTPVTSKTKFSTCFCYETIYGDDNFAAYRTRAAYV